MAFSAAPIILLLYFFCGYGNFARSIHAHRDFSHFSGKVFFSFRTPRLSMGGNSSFASSERRKKLRRRRRKRREEKFSILTRGGGGSLIEPLSPPLPSPQPQPQVTKVFSAAPLPNYENEPAPLLPAMKWVYVYFTWSAERVKAR